MSCANLAAIIFLILFVRRLLNPGGIKIIFVVTAIGEAFIEISDALFRAFTKIFKK